MRRACSVDVKPRSVYPRAAAAVEALALDRSPATAGGTRSPRSVAARRAARGGRARRPAAARARRRARARAARAARAPARAARADSPDGPRRRAARARAPPPAPSRSRKSPNSSAPSRKTGVVPLGMRAQRVDRARVLVEHDARRRGTPRAASAQPDRGRRLDGACAPGSATTSDDDRVEPERLPSRPRASATWPLCGGSNAPPKIADHGRARASRRRSRPRRPARAPAARSARSSSSALGRRADDAEPAVGAEQMPRARLRLAAGRRGSRRARPRRGSPARRLGDERRRARAGTRRCPRPSRTRARTTRDDPRRRRSRRHGARRARSTLFRTTICGSASSPAPYAASSASIVRHCSSSGRERVDHVHERARALEVGEELVAEPDALARALDQARERRRRRAGGRRARRPCRGPAGAS